MKRIIWNDLKLLIRDKEVLFWALVFPIILVVLLGNALKTQFPTRDNMNRFFEDMAIEYVSRVDGEVNQSFDAFLQKVQEDMGIRYRPSDNLDDSIQKVRDKEITLAVEIVSETDFLVTKNSTMKSGIAGDVINRYVETYNLLETVRKKGNPDALDKVYEGIYHPREYGQYETFTKKTRDISAMDYYGIANICAMMFWMMTTVLVLFGHERETGLFGRIRISGIGKSSYLMSKFISMSTFLFAQAMVLLLFNHLFLKVYIGEDVPRLILFLGTCILCVSAIATCILVVFTKLDKGIGILNAVVPVVVFLGGGMMPILDFSRDYSLNRIAQYTPLFIHNRSAFAIINGGGEGVVHQGFMINILATVVLLMIAITIYNRKEVKA